MKIIIDMDKYAYMNALKDIWVMPIFIREALNESIPLPEGHGRLIDADDIDSICDDSYIFSKAVDLINNEIGIDDFVDEITTNYREEIKNIPTIIEADKVGGKE